MHDSRLTHDPSANDNLYAPVNDPARIKRRYRQFADTECKGYSDTYYALALAVSEDDELVGFIADMPVIQPNLFLASIQLLAGPEDMPRAAAELRTFVRRRGREIGNLMRSRRTQTNEVGRCSVLLPALPPGPLALVEVGASAGLCLLLDRFYYEFGSASIGEDVFSCPSAVCGYRTRSSPSRDSGGRMAARPGFEPHRRAGR